MNREESIFDESIAEALGLSLDTFSKIKKEMTDNDISYLYFYMGASFNSKNDEYLLKTKNIINKYLREDKLNRILKYETKL